MTIFITGGAGYIGAMLLDIFSKRADVDRIIAIDRAPLPDFLKDDPEIKKKVTFFIHACADTEWIEKVKQFAPEVVIHTAWQIRELYGKKEEQWRLNVHGSDNVFDFAFSTPSVKKLIHFSTVASYAAYPTNTIEHRFTEEEVFRKSDYLYAEEKRVCEEHLQEKYKKSNKNVEVAIIRPASITGPRGRFMRTRFNLQSVLSGQLKGSVINRAISLMVSVMPITKKWCRQFIHEDDIADIVALLTFTPLKNKYEIINACPPGPVMTGKDMAKTVGKKAVYIHPQIIRIIFFLMWHLTRGRVPTSKGGWKSYSYPIVVDGSKITRLYGFTYTMSAQDAFIKKEGRYAKYIPMI